MANEGTVQITKVIGDMIPKGEIVFDLELKYFEMFEGKVSLSDGEMT